MDAEAKLPVRARINGTLVERAVPARQTLADFLRDDLDLTGTHVGCGHGVCGACTVLFDGVSVRSCLMLAVQANGHDVTTVEGLAGEGGELHPAQRAFSQEHGLQCGFCTPGFLVTTAEIRRYVRRLVETEHPRVAVLSYQELSPDAKLQPLHKHLFVEPNPIPAKWALQQMKRIGAGIRLPLVPLAEMHYETVRGALRAAGAL